MVERVRREVLGRLDQTKELTDEEIWSCIDGVIVEYSKSEYIPLPKRSRIRKGVFDSLRRLDILQELLEDGEITEIMVNGCEDIFVERRGSLERLERHFASKERLSDVIQLMVAKVNRRVNEASPIVDSRLEDGSRVNVVLNPVALNGPIVTVRKFPKKPVTMEMLIAWQAVSRDAAGMIKDMVKAGYNIIVCGGTGSGKTTFLNAMSDYIPKGGEISRSLCGNDQGRGFVSFSIFNTCCTANSRSLDCFRMSHFEDKPIRQQMLFYVQKNGLPNTVCIVRIFEVTNTRWVFFFEFGHVIVDFLPGKKIEISRVLVNITENIRLALIKPTWILPCLASHRELYHDIACAVHNCVGFYFDISPETIWGVDSNINVTVLILGDTAKVNHCAPP